MPLWVFQLAWKGQWLQGKHNRNPWYPPPLGSLREQPNVFPSLERTKN